MVHEKTSRFALKSTLGGGGSAEIWSTNPCRMVSHIEGIDIRIAHKLEVSNSQHYQNLRAVKVDQSCNFNRLPFQAEFSYAPVNCNIVFLSLCRLKKVPLKNELGSKIFRPHFRSSLNIYKPLVCAFRILLSIPWKWGTTQYEVVLKIF